LRDYRQKGGVKLLLPALNGLAWGFASLAPQKSERKEIMNNMTQGIIFYTGKQRIGKLQITRLCFMRMNQYGITTDELEEVFRYGNEIEEGKIEYGEIGLFYVLDDTRLFRGNLEDNKFIIITCWKEVNK
jgi:hypothetical protein